MLPSPQDRRLGRRKESDLKNPLGNPQREELRQELERIAFGEATSGRRALAKVTALRSLERLSRPAEPAAEQVDDDGRCIRGRRSSGPLIVITRMSSASGGVGTWKRRDATHDDRSKSFAAVGVTVRSKGGAGSIFRAVGGSNPAVIPRLAAC